MESVAQNRIETEVQHRRFVIFISWYSPEIVSAIIESNELDNLNLLFGFPSFVIWLTLVCFLF